MTERATCHCGAVRLSFPRLALDTVRRCDCSMCRRRGTIMVSVPVGELSVEAGETLQLYQFGSRIAEHWFCGICGIYTHHRRRSDPTQYGVNLGCVDGAEVRGLDVPWFDGRTHPADRDD